MSGTFNGQILVDKLVKLNSSQQSIETLSHWCIFHRNKAKQVVETWARQFHCSPREQRVPFLYLANDILQNSRRKGLEFVTEFWKVLPGALNDVLENGDEFGRKTVLRLVAIWEERKVFGSRGQILKEELLGRNLENRNGKCANYNLKQPSGSILEKLISSYEQICNGTVDEDDLLGKCQTAISCVEKVKNEVGSDFNIETLTRSGVVEELQGQHGILRECIEKLKASESSRTILVSLLREAIHEQEFKIEQIRNQLQTAQSRYEQLDNIYQQLASSGPGQLPAGQGLKESPSAFTEALPARSQASAGDEEQSTPVRYTPQSSFADNAPHAEEEQRKTAAAAMAEKLAASTSSAQMLSFVLSSLASEGVIGQSMKEDDSSSAAKRPKLENGTSAYIPPQPQPPLPPFPHPDSLQQPTPLHPSSSPATLPGPTIQPPSPVSTLLPMAPLQPPATQFMQAAGPMTGVPYSYGSAQPPLRPHPLPGFPVAGMPPIPGPPIPYQSLQASEGTGLFSQPPLPMTPPPQSRQ